VLPRWPPRGGVPVARGVVDLAVGAADAEAAGRPDRRDHRPAAEFGEAPDAVAVKLPPGPNAPIFYRIPTTQKVAFLTMDDGFVQQSSDLKVMAAAHIPFTMFLIGPVAAKKPGVLQDAPRLRRGHRGPHAHPTELEQEAV